MFCFGVSNHSIDAVIAFLQKHRIVAQPSEIAIVSFGTKLSEKRPLKNKVVFLTNISDFLRNYRILNKTGEGKYVFLFASPLRVREYDCIVPLDFVQSTEYRNMAYRLTGLDARHLHKDALQPVTAIKRNSADYLTKLIDSVKSGSLLNPLMTFIYMLPKSSHQTPVKESIAMGFLCNWNRQKVFDDIHTKGLQLGKKATSLLTDILDSEVAGFYREAFALYNKEKKIGTPNLVSISKKFNVSDYEMRYMLHVVDAYDKVNGSRGKAISYVGKRVDKPVVKKPHVAKKPEVKKPLVKKAVIAKPIKKIQKKS